MTAEIISFPKVPRSVEELEALAAENPGKPLAFDLWWPLYAEIVAETERRQRESLLERLKDVESGHTLRLLTDLLLDQYRITCEDQLPLLDQRIQALEAADVTQESV